MAQPFFALITPVGGGGPVDPGYSPPWARPQPPYPDQGLPPGQGGVPTQPIYLPPYPSQGLPPFPSQGLPGPQPVPTPPIYYPRPPVYPDQGLPGGQPYPDQGLPPGQGGYPSHPIYLPPYPSQGLPPFPSHPIAPGGPPLGVWGPNDPRPTQPIYLPSPPGSGAPPIAAQLPVFPPEATHPIVLPPEVAPPTTPDGSPIDWKVVWAPSTGWVVVMGFRSSRIRRRLRPKELTVQFTGSRLIDGCRFLRECRRFRDSV